MPQKFLEHPNPSPNMELQPVESNGSFRLNVCHRIAKRTLGLIAGCLAGLTLPVTVPLYLYAQHTQSKSQNRGHK